MIQEVEQAESKLQELKPKIAGLHEALRTTNARKESISIFDEIQCLQSLEAFLKNTVIPQAKAKIAAIKQQQAQSQKLSLETFVKDLPGERKISDQEFFWLKAQLAGFGVQEGRVLNQLINEILYEVRFGSLKVRRADQKPMGVRHGLNIALKLLRGGLWAKPVGLEILISQKLK